MENYEKAPEGLTPEQCLEHNLRYFLKGNVHAIKFCMDLFEISQVWDDLVDKDNPVSGISINDAFQKALFVIPGNLFYAEHVMSLRPLMMNCILQWEDANVLEKRGDDARHKAYMLRAGIYEIFCYCAFLIGGIGWYRKIGPDMRMLYGETLESFMEEMKNA